MFNSPEPEEPPVRTNILRLIMRPRHIAIESAQDRRPLLEKPLVKFLSRHALRQFQPVVEPAVSGVDVDAEVFEGGAVTGSLPCVVFLDGFFSFFYARGFQQLHGVQLAGVGDASHAEAGGGW